MTSQLILITCLSIGISSALVAGVFQAFSDFVMRGLIAAHPAGGIDAMQQLNRTVFRSVFLVLLLGLAPVTGAFASYAALNLSGPVQVWIISGATIYVSSVFFVTMLGNVPLNNRLDKMDFSQPETAAFWLTYGRVWTNWNHVRTLGALATAICFIIAGVLVA